jgi:hypothetical protein
MPARYLHETSRFSCLPHGRHAHGLLLLVTRVPFFCTCLGDLHLHEEGKIVLSAPVCLTLCATSLAENRSFHLKIA